MIGLISFVFKFEQLGKIGNAKNTKTEVFKLIVNDKI